MVMFDSWGMVERCFITVTDGTNTATGGLTGGSGTDELCLPEVVRCNCWWRIL